MCGTQAAIFMFMCRFNRLCFTWCRLSSSLSSPFRFFLGKIVNKLLCARGEMRTRKNCSNVWSHEHWNYDHPNMLLTFIIKKNCSKNDSLAFPPILPSFNTHSRAPETFLHISRSTLFFILVFLGFLLSFASHFHSCVLMERRVLDFLMLPSMTWDWEWLLL